MHVGTQAGREDVLGAGFKGTNEKALPINMQAGAQTASRKWCASRAIIHTHGIAAENVGFSVVRYIECIGALVGAQFDSH